MTALAAPAPAPAPAPPAPARPRRVVVGRRLAVASLVVGSTLNAVESMVARPLIDPEAGPAERAAAIEASELPLTLALVAGLVAIPFMALAFQALAHLVRERSPRLAAVGAGMTLVGCFGFLAVHVPNVVEHGAVRAGVDPESTDAVLSSLSSSPAAGLLLAAFLVGLFGGLAVLVVGLWRSRAVPRWVPATLLAFLVLDLLANGRTGGLDPHPLWVAGCLGAAAVIARRSDDEWENG